MTKVRFGWALAIGIACAAPPALAGIPLDPSFAGIGLHDQATDLAQTAWPPSPRAAVGLNHVVEMTNQSVAIYTKGGARLSHVRLRDFLRIKKSGVTHEATFDPQVVFDAQTL